jgi:hypothetical protein
MISDSLRGVAIQYLSIVGWAMPTKTPILWAMPRLLTLWLFWGMLHAVFLLVFNMAETFHWLGF